MPRFRVSVRKGKAGGREYTHVNALISVEISMYEGGAVVAKQPLQTSKEHILHLFAGGVFGHLV